MPCVHRQTGRPDDPRTSGRDPVHALDEEIGSYEGRRITCDGQVKAQVRGTAAHSYPRDLDAGGIRGAGNVHARVLDRDRLSRGMRRPLRQADVEHRVAGYAGRMPHVHMKPHRTVAGLRQPEG